MSGNSVRWYSLRSSALEIDPETKRQCPCMTAEKSASPPVTKQSFGNLTKARRASGSDCTTTDASSLNEPRESGVRFSENWRKALNMRFSSAWVNIRALPGFPSALAKCLIYIWGGRVTWRAEYDSLDIERMVRTEVRTAWNTFWRQEGVSWLLMTSYRTILVWQSRVSISGILHETSGRMRVNLWQYGGHWLLFTCIKR